MTMDLTEEQAVLLRELLDYDLRELRMEIADTDNHAYKKNLRERELVLRSILDLVGGPITDRT
ncbi:MAG TPA: hypothetical protein VF855_04765 [Acidimicrobiales bacterium]